MDKAGLKKIRQERLNKLENIRKSGINPYPTKSHRDFFINEVIKNFNKFSSAKKELHLVGRIKLIRIHGGSTFVDFEDESGKLQAYFKKDILGERYNFFIKNFDIGDFIEVKGKLFLTKRGEKTIEVNDFRVLAKTLLPLPEKWHGLKDIEERSRKRYLDLLMNPDSKARFNKRNEIIRKLRQFLEREGFIEVETPILQPIPGGALARPFKTHHNALDLDLYLRIAPELYLKRLVVGGFEKVYEIGKCFRNEGIDATHNPDFTMLEFYWAYADYNELMNLTEKMFQFLVPEGNIIYENQKIDLKTPWPRITLRDLIINHLDIDIEKATLNQIKEKLKKIGVKPEDNKDCRAIDALFKVVRPKLIKPTFVIDYPIEMSPLAKSKENNPRLTERFQLIIGGLELVNAYSELNDPIEQAKRIREQVKKHGEDVRYDGDFIEALEYGMPPTAGWGMGIDRLVALLTNTHNLRDVILFPLMKPKRS